MAKLTDQAETVHQATIANSEALSKLTPQQYAAVSATTDAKNAATEDPLNKALDKAGAGISASLKNPSMIVGDLVNGAIAPFSLIAKGVGAAMEDIGKKNGDKKLESAGAAVQRVDHDIDVVTEKKPLSSAEIIGGAVVTVVGAVTGGVVSTAGVALMAKGIGDVVGQVAKDETAYQTVSPGGLDLTMTKASQYLADHGKPLPPTATDVPGAVPPTPVAAPAPATLSDWTSAFRR